MQYDRSESSTQMDRRLRKSRKPASGDVVVNARPILACRVRQIDGRLASFDILKVLGSIESSMLTIGRDLDTENQNLVHELCSQVIDVLVQDMPENGIIDVDDLQVQVEITLMLNRHKDLAKAYRESCTV